LEDKDGVRPYIKRWEKIKMGHCNKPEDGKKIKMGPRHIWEDEKR